VTQVLDAPDCSGAVYLRLANDAGWVYLRYSKARHSFTIQLQVHELCVCTYFATDSMCEFGTAHTSQVVATLLCILPFHTAFT
jgi:hypothetical protein